MDEVRFLVAQIERLKPFPDVPDALARLKTRYKIAVLSNGDPDMLEAAKPFHKVPFDAVISVAVAGSFKPHVATYTKAAERTCGVSVTAIASLRSRSKGEMTPCAPFHVSASRCVSSEPLEIVFDSV